MKNQGEIKVERPRRAGQKGDDGGDEWGEGQVILKGDNIPDDLVGFYTFKYECADRTDRETIIELRKDGGLIRGEYYAPVNMTQNAKWVQKPVAVEVSFQGDRKMKWQFKEYSGRRVVVEIDYEVFSTGAVSTRGGTHWWYSNDPGEVQDCRLYKLGYRTELHELFSEGDYIIDLDLILDPNKDRIEGKMKFRLEYTSNTLFISESTSRKNPDKFEPCQPTVFTLLEKEGQISFRAVNGLGWSRKEHFALRTLEDGTKEVRLWWNYRDYNAGHGPDASGTLTRQED